MGDNDDEPEWNNEDEGKDSYEKASIKGSVNLHVLKAVKEAMYDE